jgi:hypothetical protein
MRIEHDLLKIVGVTTISPNSSCLKVKRGMLTLSPCVHPVEHFREGAPLRGVPRHTYSIQDRCPSRAQPTLRTDAQLPESRSFRCGQSFGTERIATCSPKPMNRISWNEKKKIERKEKGERHIPCTQIGIGATETELLNVAVAFGLAVHALDSVLGLFIQPCNTMSDNLITGKRKANPLSNID